MNGGLNKRILKACAENTAWVRTKAGLLRWDDPQDPVLRHVLSVMTEGKLGEANEFWVLRMDPGSNRIFLHVHADWNTSIYYPQDHSSKLFTDSLEIEAVEGRIVDLESGTPHGIEANNSQTIRYSVVCLHSIDLAREKKTKPISQGVSVNNIFNVS